MRHGMSVIELKKPVHVISSASVVGRHEHAGPLGGLFDFWAPDDAFGMDTWERAEAEMQRLALSFALNKCGEDDSCLDAVFAGDLMNQCT